MTPESRRKIHLLLLAIFVIAAIRTGIIFYNRHEDRIAALEAQKKRDLGYSNADYYVNPKKLHPYDIKSAKQLTQQPAWVREGYHYTYYRYDAATRHVDFTHDAGLLGPIEKLHIIDVIASPPPHPGEDRQVMAIFEKDGKDYAMPIGVEADGEYKIYSDDIFFIEDPHDLYKHWPADVWQAIDHHEVKPGMSEQQADFAVGMGIPNSGGDNYEKTVHYANGGKPLVITFHNGKAADIHPDNPAS